MIVGEAGSGAEAFAVPELVRELLADQHVGLSENEQQFRQRARDLITERRPGCSDGFVTHVTYRAWVKHVVRTVRIELSPAAIRLVAEFAATAPDGVPAVEELRAQVARATQTLGWGTAPAPTEKRAR